MRLRVLVALTALALAGAPSAQAADPPNFDFYGFAIIPSTIGAPLTLRSVLTNNGVVPTPIALDFTLNQYTLVVTGTLSSGNPNLPGTAKFSPASISIYEDSKGGGTAADYGAPGTFVDGTLILSGDFTPELSRIRLTSTLGSFAGTIAFDGGSRLGDLPTPVGWPFLGGWSRSSSLTIPAGYHEAWDGKIDLSTVAVESKSWSGVKGLFE
jgi:hypothetical protein